MYSSEPTVLVAQCHDLVHLVGIVNNVSEEVLHVHSHVGTLLYLEAHCLVLA